MAITILFHKGIKKDIKKLPKNIQDRFFRTLPVIEKDPLSGIPLKGEFETSRKVRLGDYRIVYKFNPKDKIVIIYRIESRAKVYK